MNHDEERLWLIEYLLDENRDYASIGIPNDSDGQWRLLRSLMNVRPAGSISDDFLSIQDEFLQEEIRRKGVTDIISLEPIEGNLYLWQGDITTLRCDATVNAANSGMTGCYVPCHGCIDNAIHTYAGIQLRLECSEIMRKQGHEEETGKAKITNGWNLPSSHVIHTVGPIVYTGKPTSEDMRLLSSCYRSCLSAANENNLGSIAFCCISTGEFHFPNYEAASIAMETVTSGFDYSGERFEKVFGDFHQKYGITDMYSGGFYPFPTSEEYWAWWSRMIWINRYTDEIGKPYSNLLTIIRDKDYFIITTNVDHQVQKAGFDRKRLFYTQGDYGLFQCSEPCHQKTYDNKGIIRKMLDEQEGMRIPSELIPHCPVCGKPMTTNLRIDDRFVQDDGWYDAAHRYEDFLNRHKGMHILFLELGVGMNTPGIIKYPFWRKTAENTKAVYCTINSGQAFVPSEIRDRSIALDADIKEAVSAFIV